MTAAGGSLKNKSPGTNEFLRGVSVDVMLLAGALALVLLTPCGAVADDSASTAMPLSLTQKDAADATDHPDTRKPGPEWEIEARKSYQIPVLEILGFDFLLNRVNNSTDHTDTYNVSASSAWRNLTHGWVIDNDPFSVNQFAHPYQGAMYHGFARSAGLSYWEASAYTFAGSTLWEFAGETTKPSKNDQVASGIAGSFFGEALFRMANLLLEKDEGNRYWRELGAAAISPSMGFNRLAFGNRFDPVFSSRGAAYDSRFSVGGSLTALNHQGASQSFIRNEAVADFTMDYGLPGKADYYYTRPFDYFRFRFTASSANSFENIMVRGLLFGKELDRSNNNYRGVWGLYGSYDYIAPQIFRVSSTALSLGTTGQAWLTDSIALQGTGLLGLGYGAAGTIHGISDRDYHYGATPQALLDLRLIFGQRVSLDLAARGYYVSDVASPDSGWEKITRLDAGVTTRVYKRHAFSLKYTYSHRNASFPDLGGLSQSRGTVSIFYTFLGDTKFSAIHW